MLSNFLTGILFMAGLLCLPGKVWAQPANDNCGSATLLTSSTSCVNTNGTVIAATNSGVAVAPCTGTADDDVWYRFVSVSTDHTITLSNIGSNLNLSGPRLQLFSGTCGALTSLACGTTNITVTNLARNTTYYIRVYSAGNTAITSNGGFRICVTHPTIPTPLIDFGKSYVNISKPSGGTVETNDILEIRATVVVRSGSFDSCSFNDVIPAGTSYIPGTLRILTNEGKIYKQFTDSRFDASNDEGWISGSNITMNMGYRDVDQPATVYRRGRIRNNNGHKPNFGGNNTIQMASYRVQVTAAGGSVINLGGGNITYTTTPPTVSSFNFPSRQVAVYTNFGICANSVGVNSLGTEFNGSFGNGNLRNRGTSANVPAGYTYSGFAGTNMPNDYYYAIANNTSTQSNYSTVNTWAKPDNSSPTHRVFRLWDIIGDHTGAADPLAGNPAADTTNGNTGGYMLVINAAYRIDSAFQHTITGLCPNTYYEISCWMRNICSKCGNDSNAVSAGSGGYIPTGPGDSSGVKPNLAMALDGVDYYTTGDLPYTGQWVKKGFTFLTGPSQTSFTLRYYNNAPGGGGNDWALDDITVATCSPNMQYSPSLNPNICEGNSFTLYDTVRSYFSNYVYYQWQRSTDGGVTWTDVTGPSGPASPVWNGSEWEYVTSYTVPPSETQMANSGDMYRLVAATTPGNLSDPGCRFTDEMNIITSTVIDCGVPLNTTFISFSGRTDNNYPILSWTSSRENEALGFDIEKSFNGTDFSWIGSVNSHQQYNAELNSYSFTEPLPLTQQTFYRIKMYNNSGKSVYSKVIYLANPLSGLQFMSVINPFSQQLQFDINSEKKRIADAELVDQFGRSVKKTRYDLTPGNNRLHIHNTGHLPPGIYYLRIHSEGMIINRKVVKK